jgi:hypothetical protein
VISLLYIIYPAVAAKHGANNKEAVISAAAQHNAPYGKYSITLVTGV